MCEKSMFSPSNTPQEIATTGIRYVTEEAKIAEESFISLLKITTARDVPMTARIAMYKRALVPLSVLRKSIKLLLKT